MRPGAFRLSGRAFCVSVGAFLLSGSAFRVSGGRKSLNAGEFLLSTGTFSAMIDAFLLNDGAFAVSVGAFSPIARLHGYALPLCAPRDGTKGAQTGRHGTTSCRRRAGQRCYARVARWRRSSCITRSSHMPAVVGRSGLDSLGAPAHTPAPRALARTNTP